MFAGSIHQGGRTDPVIILHDSRCLSKPPPSPPWSKYLQQTFLLTLAAKQTQSYNVAASNVHGVLSALYNGIMCKTMGVKEGTEMA